MALSSTLRMGSLAACGALQHRSGLRRLLTPDEVDDAARLLGRDTDVPRLRLGFHRCPFAL